MSKSITPKTLPIAAIATAIFALTAATSFAADNKTLSWEFGDGQAHGWQIVSGEVGFYDGGMSSATYETRDAEQATFLARSPMFRLNGGGGLKITLNGGMGKRLPANARQFLAKPRTSGGAMGVARNYGSKRLDTKKHQVSGVKLSANGLVAEVAVEGLAGDRLFQIDVRNVASKGAGRCATARPTTLSTACASRAMS